METRPWDTYRTRSHFFGGPLILMDKITEWPDWMAEFARKEIEIYKSVRKLIRDGKVYHLTPPPDGTFNDYIQSYHEASDRSVIFVYRQETPSDVERVRPRGLRPETTYRVRFQEDPRLLVAKGRELMETGFDVRLPSQWFAEVVYVEPEALADRGGLRSP
jgi:alpha-galactosidase